MAICLNLLVNLMLLKIEGAALEVVSAVVSKNRVPIEQRLSGLIPDKKISRLSALPIKTCAVRTSARMRLKRFSLKRILNGRKFGR